MAVHPACLVVAFLRGDPGRWWDRLVMDGTCGPFVHTEVWLHDGRGLARGYSSFENVGGVVPIRPGPYGADWTLLSLPLAEGGFQRLYASILSLLSVSIPYNSRDLWQCCVSAFLPFESDLDPTSLTSWRRGVFCSQFACLLLRLALLQGTLSLPGDARGRLCAVNSRGCSPNALYCLLTGTPHAWV